MNEHWCIMFNDGRTNVHDEEHMSQSSVELEGRIERKFQGVRGFTIDRRLLFFGEVSRTWQWWNCLQKKLCKMCSSNVLKKYKKNFKPYWLFWVAIVMMPMSFWITSMRLGFRTSLQKQSSNDWNKEKTKKVKQILSTTKVMAPVFWNRKCVFLVDYMSRGEIINAESYVRRDTNFAARSKTKGADCWPAASSFSTTTPFPTQFYWRKTCFSCLSQKYLSVPYIPDSAPSGFHLFPKLEDILGGNR